MRPSVALASGSSIDVVAQEEAMARSMWRITLHRLKRSKTAMIGLTIVALLFLVALLADVVAPYSPTETTPESISPPTWQHLMGTDLLGRDVLSRVIYGSRVSCACPAGRTRSAPNDRSEPNPCPRCDDRSRIAFR